MSIFEKLGKSCAAFTLANLALRSKETEARAFLHALDIVHGGDLDSVKRRAAELESQTADLSINGVLRRVAAEQLAELREKRFPLSKDEESTFRGIIDDLGEAIKEIDRLQSELVNLFGEAKDELSRMRAETLGSRDSYRDLRNRITTNLQDDFSALSRKWEDMHA